MSDSVLPKLQASLPAEIESAYGADLYRAIFRSENPEYVVRALPAQRLYLALLGIGLESGADLIDMLPQRHYRVALDLHLWEKDGVSASGFWQWLEVIDDAESLEPLRKFLQAVDPKLLAVLFSRHIHSIIGEERTDVPPAEGYYTPDQGYTWVEIQIEDPTKLRLFARLIAMLYQTDSPLFYQLLNESSAASMSELEEESFQDKSRRLSDEGLPDLETSAKINSATTIEQFLVTLSKASRQPTAGNHAFSGMVKRGDRLEPLSSLLEEVSKDEAIRGEIESELSLIVNAAIFSFLSVLSDASALEKQVAHVRGTLNIGLERACVESKLSPLEVVRATGLQPIYRLGLGELRALRRQIREILSRQSEEISDAGLRSIAAHIVDGDFPSFPMKPFEKDGELKISQDDSEFREFQSLAELSLVRETFREKLSH